MLDVAIQAHGGAGVTEDFGLAAACATRTRAAHCRRRGRGASQPGRQARTAQAPRLGGDAGRAAMHEFRLKALPTSMPS